MKDYVKTFLQIVFVLSVAFPLFADEKNIKKEPLVKKGGISSFKLVNECVPFDNVVTGGQPTFDQLRMAHEAGFKAIVNLRTDKEQPSPAEESTWVEELGMKYFPIPVEGAQGVSLENAGLLAGILSKEENYPLIVHCQSGNRVGALFAVKTFSLDGKREKEALAIGREAGLTTLAPVVQKIFRHK